MVSLDCSTLDADADREYSCTISAGTTYTDVTHSLGFTPDIDRFTFFPQSNLEGKDIWVSDVGVTTFRVNISSKSLTDYTIGCMYHF